MVQIIRKIIKSPQKYLSPLYILNILAFGRLFIIWRQMSRFITSDKLFLKVYYRLGMQERLNLKNPQSFTQKIQWLKLHNTNPFYSILVDKYEVRKVVAEKIGSGYLIPLLGVWSTYDDINFDNLPEQFVLKTTHDSGSVIVCTAKSLFDKSATRNKLNKALKRNYFYCSREFPYKNAVPRIIAEEFMYDEHQKDLTDYKFFCFNGEPKILLLVTHIGSEKCNNYFDMDFNPLPFSTGFDRSKSEILQPSNLEEMVAVAKKLSSNLIHVRIDLYNINGKVYFGEYTFHHGGGLTKFIPSEWNKKLGDMIELPVDLR